MYSEFEKYKKKVDSLIENDIENNTRLRPLEPHRQSLTDGQRLRPGITLSILDSLNQGRVNINVNLACLVVEYLHNASLIVDDLPIMDNDSVRRNQPTLHISHNPRMAHLTSYNLIVVSNAHLSKALYNLNVGETRYRQIYQMVNELVADKLDLSKGLCLGQYIDLYITDELRGLSVREKKQRFIQMVNGKTGSLFSLAFLLGWIFSNQNLEMVNQVDKLGEYFGLCYQILDDLRDYKQDCLCDNSKLKNIFSHFTIGESVKLFNSYVDSYIDTLNCLKLGHVKYLTEIIQLVQSKFRTRLTWMAHKRM